MADSQSGMMQAPQPAREHNADTETGRVVRINGPIVTVDLAGLRNGEQVSIGALDLVGEVISLQGKMAVVQAYEPTDSLRPGEGVRRLGFPLSVELGPGLLGEIFDGVQRPLRGIRAMSGHHVGRGLKLFPLDRKRKWSFETEAMLRPGVAVTGGQVIGTVPETETILHRVLVPPHVGGELVSYAPSGTYTLEQPVAGVRDRNGTVHQLRLFHRWPVRTARPYRTRDHASVPLITGQRILDTFFPLLKGGKAAVPGPFGAGKTMVQQQIARWANADIVIYVGCGERGNELVDILQSFPQLKDPHTGRSMMERTLVVANTSNMPVVAREASIYVGVTIAEYYRDQGYDVVMVADSTSRWAEALREVGGRLGQMPVEEGYPAYLASRLGAFYERAGRVEALSGHKGSISLIGAVSPPGGDLSEPVTRHTKEIVRTFWALSKELADARHYPAVSWAESFSGYIEQAAHWWGEHVDPRWAANRAQALALLLEAEDLSRIVNLVGPEALSPEQRWLLEGASLIREGVLQQSALDPVDSYASPAKQFVLLDLVLEIYRLGQDYVERGGPLSELAGLPLLGKVRRVKNAYESDRVQDLQALRTEVRETFDRLQVQFGARPEESG